MSEAADPKTLGILRNVADMAQKEPNGTIVDLKDGRYLALVVVSDDELTIPSHGGAS